MGNKKKDLEQAWVTYSTALALKAFATITDKVKLKSAVIAAAKNLHDSNIPIDRLENPLFEKIELAKAGRAGASSESASSKSTGTVTVTKPVAKIPPNLQQDRLEARTSLWACVEYRWLISVAIWRQII